MRRSAAVAALAASCLLALGCSKPAPRPHRLLRIALYNEPLTLDAHFRNEVLTISVLRNLYEGLTALDARTNVLPALAERWEPGGTFTWIFHLRPGVRFHNNHELTAEDVVFSFKRARNAKSNLSGYLASVAEVKARDPQTVMIKTFGPAPTLLNKLAFVFIVPSGAPEEITQPVGTGPYQLLGTYEQGKSLRLRAFKSYWGGVPPEPEVEFVPVPDVDERTRLLLAGDVDLAQDPGPANIEKIHSDPQCVVMEAESLSVVVLMIRRDRKPLDDPRLRRSIDLALDRSALVERILHQKGVPIGQMVGPNVFGYNPAISAPEPDLAKARALLIQAGYPNGLDLELQFRPGRKPEAETVMSQLHEVGIQLSLKQRSWEELFPALLAGDVPFYLGSWFCLSGDASDLLDSVVHSQDSSRGYGGSNFSRYVNPELDRMIEESAATEDLLDRRALLRKCMRTLMADLVLIPLYSPKVIFGVRDNVEWQLRGDGMILVNTIRRNVPRDINSGP
jgi:peptide/nickel transport system substrate-binding protein